MPAKNATGEQVRLVASYDGVRYRAYPAGDKPAPTVPSWVPAAGEVAVLTQANGKLLNRFRDQCASYYSAEYYVKTVNDFSGAVKNPHWGTLGATVFWGGGHSGTNDNSCTVAEYGADGITFKRVSSPTPWFGGTEGVDPGTTIRDNNSNAPIDTDPPVSNTFGDSTTDNQPGSAHSYCVGDIIGPAEGGATYGSYIMVAHANAGRTSATIGVQGYHTCHQIDFDTLTLQKVDTSYRKFYRRSDDVPAWVRRNAPWYSCYVPAQGRVYFFSKNDTGDGNPVRWFNLATNVYEQGTGTQMRMDLGDGSDSGTVFHVPSRNLMIVAFPIGGTLRVEWMSVAAGDTNPTAGGIATLSSALSVSNPWSMACWCKDNNRIIVGGVTGDDAAVYEIEIPATLTNTWTVTRAPFGSGQTLPKADSTIGITYKKWSYDDKIKAIVYMPLAAFTGDDTVWVYRPTGT